MERRRQDKETDLLRAKLLKSQLKNINQQNTNLHGKMSRLNTPADSDTKSQHSIRSYENKPNRHSSQAEYELKPAVRNVINFGGQTGNEQILIAQGQAATEEDAMERKTILNCIYTNNVEALHEMRVT
jgi:hypothetical protein